MPHEPFSSKDDWKKSFWVNIHFGRVVVWGGVNQMIIHFFFKHPLRQVAVILFILFFKSSHGAKYTAGAAKSLINSVPFLNHLCLIFCIYPSTHVKRTNNMFQKKNKLHFK